MKYKIYKLIHNGVLVYVGKTKLTLSRRKNGSYKGTSVENISKECQIELIEETDDVSRERYWIEFYKDIILNVLRGDGLDHKEYLGDWEKKNYKERVKYREDRKEIKKEYDRQRYLKRKEQK